MFLNTTYIIRNFSGYAAVFVRLLIHGIKHCRTGAKMSVCPVICSVMETCCEHVKTSSCRQNISNTVEVFPVTSYGGQVAADHSVCSYPKVTSVLRLRSC